ncbi:chemotaxis protein [Alkalihalobacillus hemicellulosilyticus]|uniref:Chemotaxis protein CheV n=1 Tax=Halalkalibacter hemicellulosilyticusJCM 9152 TaxID=1236971 RepID=W4QAJ4_9BACI|nr:chemotaxis protein [Halalkalibacter hemicellulosilyticus]GAE29071.1 chemotaxis protein CheV [Halalkalibacter hemicellulosilyticusJCM 9152]
MDESKQGILLETGTNELEIIVFEVGTSLFGINVLKVREIIPAQTITPIPNSHRHIEGIIRLREEVITVVNLTDVLGFEPANNLNDDKFIIAELNQLKVAFRVQDVSRIHRISWQDIRKPNELAQNIETAATGVVKVEDDMILLVDFEKIIVDINPERSISVHQVKQLGERERNNKKIIVAEDSAILRKLIGDTLKEAGYDQVQFFEDGQALWEFLYNKKEDESLFDDLQLVITDIEMPKMDGHHLTRRIKDDEILQQLPVVIFSSLITEDLFYKGKGVGADAQISKPQIVDLIKVIDQLVL